MKILIVFVILLVSLSAFSETYDDSGYCNTDKYQELRKCLIRNIKLSSDKIKEMEKVYVGELSKDGVAGYDEARVHWESYVNSSCRLHAESSGGGSVKPIRNMSCQYRANLKRIDELGCFVSYHLADGNVYQQYCKKHEN